MMNNSANDASDDNSEKDDVEEEKLDTITKQSWLSMNGNATKSWHLFEMLDLLLNHAQKYVRSITTNTKIIQLLRIITKL